MDALTARPRDGAPARAIGRPGRQVSGATTDRAPALRSRAAGPEDATRQAVKERVGASEKAMGVWGEEVSGKRGRE